MGAILNQAGAGCCEGAAAAMTGRPAAGQACCDGCCGR